MSHGNTATDHGTCQCCGREGVALHVATKPDRFGEYLSICVNEFACFSQWQSDHCNTPTSVRRSY